MKYPATSRPITTKDRGASASSLLPVVLLITAAVITALGPGIGGDFLNWDDDRNFIRNDAFRGIGLAQLQWAWQTYHLGVWQPVAWILLGAQAPGGTLDSRVFHGVSLALHAINCVLLYLLMIRILEVRAAGGRANPASHRIGAAATALLFAAHPLRVEAVTWISCQPYLPAAMFYLLAIHAHIRATDAERPKSGRHGWMTLSLACFLLAMGCKAVAVSLPVVLLILDLWVLRRRENSSAPPAVVRLVLKKVPYVIAAVPVCVWAMAAKDCNASRVPWTEANFGERFAQSAYGICFYLYRTLVPTGLSPYYRLPDGIHPGHWPYWGCVAFVVATTVTLIVLRRRAPGLLAAWLAYLAILLPNLGIVQISRQIAADRYAYLAVMPIMIVAAHFIARLWRGGGEAAPDAFPTDSYTKPVRTHARVAILGVLAILIFAEVAATRAYAAHWLSSDALWRRAIALDPECAVAHCNLGEDLLRREDYTEASRHLARAIDLDPDFAFAYANFAALLVRAGAPADAVRACERAMSANPPLTGLDLAKTHAILGEAYAAMRKDDLAWEHTLKAKELGFAEADRMIAYLRQFSEPPEKAKRADSPDAR